MPSKIWMPSDLPKRRIWTAREIEVMARHKAGEGLKAAAEFYKELLRQVLSVQAPYVVHFSKTGKPIFRALTKATPGAPPRRVSGNLLRRVAMDYLTEKNIARVFTDVPYGLIHELKNHKWMVPTLVRHLANLGTIAGGVMTATAYSNPGG